MRNGIFELTPGQVMLWKSLIRGYPSLQEKLNYLFFESQPEVKIKVVITDKYEPVHHFPATTREKKPLRKPNRIFTGRKDILVVYPKSKKSYLARIKTSNDLCVIEPVKNDRAFWMVNKSDLEKSDILDLNEISYIRQIHNQKGKALMDEFR
jgi:hypothetical protein